MLRQVYSKLMDAIINNNSGICQAILNHKDWPHDLTWSDYELLIYHSFLNFRKEIASLLLERGCCRPIVEDESAMEALFHTIVNKVGNSYELAETIIQCVNYGARVSYQNNSGHTTVHVAFLKKSSGKLIDLLLEQYLEETVLNFTDKDSLSVLHIACTRRNLKIVQQFVDADESNINFQVSFNARNFAGYTPLHFAVKHSQYEIVKFLLKRKANVYAQDANGSTALHLACYCWDVPMINLILQYDSITENVTDKFGLSHFMVACAGSESVIVGEYLRVAEIRPWTSPEKLICGCVKSLRNCPYAGFTPLHFAAEFGHASIVELLACEGADVNALSDQMLTPMQLAHIRKHKKVYNILKEFTD